ncbi:MAG: hypothetical protein IPI64_10735 [Chloracidobacterium sp.]|nr:hypothetical protein [Chloracidobacterium sp.]
MTYIKMILAVTFLVAAQITIASAQSSPEIERLTAEIAKAPENGLFVLERGFLYTWNGKFFGPGGVGKDVDDNRAKALADAEKAMNLYPHHYKPYYLRALVGVNMGNSGYKKDFETAARLFSESNVVANIYTFDLSGGKVVTPAYNERLPVSNVIVKGEQLSLLDGFDTLAAAKEYSKKRKTPQVIMLNTESKKLFLYEAFITENIWPNIMLAETPFRKALNGRSKLALNYETLKIEASYSVQPQPKVAALEKYPVKWQLADIVDAEGLSLLKSPSIQLLNGSKGLRLGFDSELAKGNFDEALKIYNWLDQRNTSTGGNDLDVVKISRKTNLSKLYKYAEKLRPFVEKEMTKWNYPEAEKLAVRGGK